jgi:signal peptidase I
MLTTEQRSGVALLEEVLRRFGTARVRVQGSSMVPAIRPGDEVRLQSVAPSETQPGDIVAFRQGERLFVHRVVGSSVGGLLTQGDALSSPDAPVNPDEFLGKVTQIERQGALVGINNSVLQRAAAALFRRSRTCSALFLKFASL